MRALVVYESMFGNTEKIAAAIAAGLSAHLRADVVEVGSAGPSLDGVDLLVVGGPTHAFSMSRPSTRQDAAEKNGGGTALVSRGQGIREWLDMVEGHGTAIVTFDTRATNPRLPGVPMPGSAAHAARRRLKHRGFRPVAASASFYVTGLTGPLADGEEDRARHWGEQLGLSLA